MNFASDNTAPVLPEVMAAIEAVNLGRAASYGADEQTGPNPGAEHALRRDPEEACERLDRPAVLPGGMSEREHPRPDRMAGAWPVESRLEGVGHLGLALADEGRKVRVFRGRPDVRPDRRPGTLYTP